MIKDFDDSIDGLIEELEAKEPMIETREVYVGDRRINDQELAELLVIDMNHPFETRNGVPYIKVHAKLSEELSPRKVRRRARNILRKFVLHGDGVFITEEDKRRAAKALGYTEDDHYGDVLASCRFHLGLERIAYCNPAEAGVNVIAMALGTAIKAAYLPYLYLKEKAMEMVK